MIKSNVYRSVDPIVSMPVQSEVNSICFVSRKNQSVFSTDFHGSENYGISQDQGGSHDDDNDFDDDECVDHDDEDGIEFRSSKIRIDKMDPTSSESYLYSLFSDRFLASCHSNGEALIWDLKNQKQVASISPPRGGPGICIRRTDDPSQIMFQTRDSRGIVSIHSIERCDTLSELHDVGTSSALTNSKKCRQFETYSKTFCRAAPCHGNRHLIALPDLNHSSVRVVDTRSDSDVAKYHIDNHGMVTSLALGVTDRRSILACGMESGTIHFFDVIEGSETSFHQSSYTIGKDPILTLDLTNSCTAISLDSSVPTQIGSNVHLVAAGMAGDSHDVSELSKDKAGRGIIFEAACQREGLTNSSWNFEQRARLSTCRVDHESYCGKPGISVCCFRPNDGCLLAIGGWDKRIRLFEKLKGSMVALLKGSTRSVADIDWAPDSMTSGLLASAHKDEKSITIWQYFPKQLSS